MRKTIASPAVVSGIGLHTGVPATMTFKPAESGIYVFAYGHSGRETH